MAGNPGLVNYQTLTRGDFNSLALDGVLASIVYYQQLADGDYRGVNFGNAFADRFAMQTITEPERIAIIDLIANTYTSVQNVVHNSGGTGLGLFTTQVTATGQTKIILDGTELNGSTTELVSDLAADIGIISQIAAQYLPSADIVIDVLEAVPAISGFVNALSQSDSELVRQVGEAIQYIEDEVAHQQQANPSLSRTQALRGIDVVGHSLGGVVGALVNDAYFGQLGDVTAFNSPIPQEVGHTNNVTLLRVEGDTISSVYSDSVRYLFLEAAEGQDRHGIAELAVSMYRQDQRIEEFRQSIPQYFGVNGMSGADYFDLFDFKFVQGGEHGLIYVGRESVEIFDGQTNQTVDLFFSPFGGSAAGVPTIPIKFLEFNEGGPNTDHVKGLPNDVAKIFVDEVLRYDQDPDTYQPSYSVEIDSSGTFRYTPINRSLFDRFLKQLDAFFQCFTAGTLIDMADGSQRPIETIDIGDMVMAFDAAGDLQPGQVTATFVNRKPVLIELSNGVRVTPDHRRRVYQRAIWQ